MGAGQSGAVYQFKVALIGITPPIWRRVQVIGDYTLAQLHRVLQVVMGWENYHLYMFRIGSKKYGPPDPDGVDDLGLVDAKRIRLAAVVPSVGTTFTYVYDYGDDWEHELLHNQEYFLRWLGASYESAAVDFAITKLDASLEFANFVVREFLTGNYSLEKHDSDVYDQFQLRYLAVDRFIIVTDDSDLTKRTIRSTPAERIVTFDQFLRML